MNRVFGYTFIFLLIDFIILISSIYFAENTNPVSEDTELTANGIYTYRYIFTFVNLYIYVYTYISMYKYIYIYIYSYMYIYICIYI
jgi:hypothetical protein